MPGPDYADEYAACRGRVRDLLADCDEGMAARVVPTCPDWTVRDLCAHLTGVAAALAARDNPAGDVQAWVDRLVAERSDRSVPTLLDEWDAVGPAFEALMRARPASFGGLTYDVVAHEHDLRGAVGRPGDRESDGVEASLEILAAMIERDLAAKGPVPGTIRLRSGAREWVIGGGAPEVAVDAPAWELMRLVGSRRSRRQLLAAGWVGDVEPFLPAIAHLPLPEHDIDE